MCRPPRERTRIVLGAVLVVVAVVITPARLPAQIVFGADLNRPVNVGFDCGAVPGPFGPAFFFPTNSQTCTWAATSVSTTGGRAENFVVPNGVGTITSVRIKVGRITGPMQVVAIRSIRGLPDPNDPQPPAGLVCCIEVGRSAVFTPAANAISTIAMNLPVKSDIVPNPLTNAVEFDTLGLSVLGAGVPVPAHDSGNYQLLAGPAAVAFFPALRPGEERFGTPAGVAGFQVLMEATWVPGTGGAPGGGAVTVAQPVASRQGRLLQLGLRCNQATPCTGVLVVQNQGAGGRAVNAAALAATTMGPPSARVAAAAKGRRPKTFAKGRFALSPDQVSEVVVKLNRRGRRQLRRNPGAEFFANVKMDGTKITAGTITVATVAP